MRSPNKRRRVTLAVLLVAGFGLSTPAAYADDDDLRGVITARGKNGTVMLRLDDSSNVMLVLDEATKVVRTDGLGDITLNWTALIPGLRVEVEGVYLTSSRFAAKRVSFSRADMKMAFAIYGGLDATNQRSLENQRRIEQNVRTLEMQRQLLLRQEQGIAVNTLYLRANEDKILRASDALDATNTRITSLADHAVVATMTVYFKNGSASIREKQEDELEQLAALAKALPAYVIQIEGHASAVGPDALNDTLSMRRADAVAAVLSQNGIPPTKMLVPATMGVSAQVATNQTAKGQSENRRAVVTLLQNKGISDSSPANRRGTTVERVDPPRR
jgi:outer membrane protein OmpA-like peptidoglycan-associated protein